MKNLVILIVFMLTACNINTFTQQVNSPAFQEINQTAIAEATSTSILEADDVHRKWVDAMQMYDRPTALTLVAPGKANLAIESWLELQKIDHDPSTGTLYRVDIHPTIAIKDGRQGYSIFSFGHLKQCYNTKLAQFNGQWKVVDWILRPDCP